MYIDVTSNATIWITRLSVFLFIAVITNYLLLIRSTFLIVSSAVIAIWFFQVSPSTFANCTFVLLSEIKDIFKNNFMLISAIRKVILKNQMYPNLYLRKKRTRTILLVFQINPSIFWAQIFISLMWSLRFFV